LSRESAKGLLDDSPDSYPSSKPPATGRIIRAEPADLHPAAGAVNKVAVTEIEAYVGDRTPGVGEGENIAGTH